MRRQHHGEHVHVQARPTQHDAPSTSRDRRAATETARHVAIITMNNKSATAKPRDSRTRTHRQLYILRPCAPSANHCHNAQIRSVSLAVSDSFRCLRDDTASSPPRSRSGGDASHQRRRRRKEVPVLHQRHRRAIQRDICESEPSRRHTHHSTITFTSTAMQQRRRRKGIHRNCTTEQHEARCSPSVGAATTVANGRADRYALSDAAKPALLGF